MINGSFSYASGCFILYYRPSNTLYLANDGDSAWQGSTTVGSGTAISNSQCTITGAGSSANGSGNELILTLNITFGSPGFAGNRIFYLAVRDVNEGNNTGWQSLGAWIVE